MALFEIKSKYDGSLIFTLECGSLRLCLEAAVKSGADLTGADLTGADLTRANLTGANLTGANLYCTNLTGANLTGADLTRAKYGEGIPLEHAPLILQGTKYQILIMDTHIKIGCKMHSHAEWESFSDKQISEMDSGALAWWSEWKGVVLSLSLGHQQRIAKGE